VLKVIIEGFRLSSSGRDLVLGRDRFLIHTNHGFPLTAEAFHTQPRCPPSARCTPHPVPPRTNLLICSPPRLQVVAFQQDPDRFSSHSWNQFAFHHFFGQQAHRPTRAAFRRRIDTPAPRYVADAAHPARPLSRPWPLVRGPLQAAFGDSVGWSAILSSGSTLSSSPPAGWAAHRPTAARPKRAAPSARAFKPLCNKRRNSSCSLWDNRTQDRSFMSPL
jgi:hypothetical protein